MFVKLPDVRLFFDVEGAKLVPDGPVMRERPTLLCLHGGPGLDHSVFRPAFSALAEVAQVVYLDQRGHGRSDRGTESQWSLSVWADDVRAFCDHLGIEHPIVFGTSFGGYVAMKYAIRYPDHPAKLILASTSARGTGILIRREHVLRAFERRGGVEAREAVQRAFDERTPEAYAEYTRVCGPLYTRRPAEADATSRMIRTPHLVPYFERSGGEGEVFDLTGELHAVRASTLVLSGNDDPITPVEEQQAIIDSMSPGLARLVRFPGCGHGILRDDPEALVRVVREALTA